MQFIEGGVCAPQGFRAAGIYAGVKASAHMSAAQAATFSQALREGKRPTDSKEDVALICADRPCQAAGVFTSNLVKSAPVLLCQQRLQNGKARAIIANSGNANTCNADGAQTAAAMARAAAQALGIPEEEVLVGSTGVIGQPLPVRVIEQAVPQLAAGLSAQGSLQAATAIMTTDRVPKSMAVAFTLGGKTARIGGITKGSGMIHPNLCTMLCFLTTDAAVSAPVLQKALAAASADTFNMLSIDGDESTNDTALLLANGLAGNALLDKAEGPDYEALCAALRALCGKLVRAMAKDGEGASKLFLCEVQGAASAADARKVAKAVVCSSLVKTAVFGADANWGRVLCAVGYSGAAVDVHKVDLDFVSAGGTLPVCRDGAGVPFDETLGKAVLAADEITAALTLHDGAAAATAYGCDLSYDYVKINGDYRT